MAMKPGTVRTVGILVIIIASMCLPATSAKIQSVGLHLILPWSRIPLSLGAEVVADAAFGCLSFPPFLSPAGGTLLVGGADIGLTSNPNAANAFLRLTTGLSYFDSARRFPSILVGAGTSVRLLAADLFTVGFADELIYSLAFPMPMFALSGAWSLP